MKNIIYTVCFLLISFCCIGQTFSISVNNLIINSGTAFTIQLNPTSPQPGCTSQTIELNIGSLVYLNTNTVLPSGATLTNNSGVITISNIQSGSGGISQTILIGVKFLAGSCDSTQQEITASLTSVGCPNPTTINATPIVVHANVDNVVNTFISQSGSQPVCIGNTVKYTIYANNSSTSGLIVNPKFYLALPLCAHIEGLYYSGTFTNASPAYVVTGNSATSQTIEWSTPNINPSGQSTNYNIHITYPCDSATSTACISGSNNLSVYLKGTSCGDEITSNTASVNTNVNTTCGESVCVGGNGGVGGSLIGIATSDNNLFCPTTVCSLGNPSVTFSLTLSPGSPSYPSLTYSTSIPAGLTVVQTTFPSLPCIPTVTYFDAGNSVTSDISLARRISWTYNCTINVPISLNNFKIRVTYDTPLPAPGATMVFSQSIATGTTTLFSEDKSVLVSSCPSHIIIDKFVKKKDQPNQIYTYASSVFGIPSEYFTYKLRIYNNAAQIASNIIIEDLLPPGQTYVGNLKYDYTTTNTPVFTDIDDNETIITDNDLGVATITHNNNSLVISGFNLPAKCDNIANYIYIEFDVQVNSNVGSGLSIINRAKVILNGAPFPFYSGQTTINISALYKVSNQMYVRCPQDDEWSNTVKVRNGEEVDLRMRFVNEGSLPVLLKEMVNLKSQPGDLMELGSVSRNSQFPVHYNCSVLPLVSSNSMSIPVSTISYSNEGVTMNRSMFCPASSDPSIPDFSATCGVVANWLRVEFPNNGFNVLPGEYVDVIYKGIVSGTSSSVITAYDSFAFKVNGCTLNSDNSNIISIINDGIGCVPPPPCIDCASFNLAKGEKYLVSGWVKEIDITAPDKQYKNYHVGSIKISFTDLGGTLIVDNPLLQFYPSGEIIDGWQRIVGEFTVPLEVDDMYFELINESNRTDTSAIITYFDDVRVLPSKGSMKSFVYDQSTQRLMAELDENNYATFYEYDLEGGLIRIKKETEKGVFTIQETRSSNPKK